MNRITLSLSVAVAMSASFVAAPQVASAFCGFYVSGADAEMFNDATMVVMMREGTRTVLSMQNSYQGPPEDFAMVVPVPEVLQEENVQTLPADVFDRVDQMAAPRLVEYWEVDPCQEDVYIDRFGGIGNARYRTGAVPEPTAAPVRVEAEFAVGEYDIVVLSADDATSLDTWLRGNDYRIPDGAEPLFRPYIEQGQYFFVARVAADRITFDDDGRAALSPLRFHYDTETFSLPIRLGLINAGEAQDLIVHILGRDQRYEVANYDNVTIPTNINLMPDGLERFSEFYVALFDRTLERNPGAVVTEYAWNASTCDPCPGVSLTSQDFLTLGADAIATGNNRSFVLTRLHARYTAESLGEDLVFSAAEPIVGGREHNQENGDLEQGATVSTVNNFQGRYMVRHPWEGEVACDEPQYGRWGGPPGTGSDDPQLGSARGTAFADRNAVQLAAVVAQDVPEIGLVRGVVDDAAPEPSGSGVVPQAEPVEGTPDEVEVAIPGAEATGSGAEAAPPEGETAPTAETPATDATEPRTGVFGCVQSSRNNASGLAGLGVLGALLVRRRRNR